MATVITNLLSAIPIFGQDLVELTNVPNILTYFDSDVSTILLPTVGTVSPHALKKERKLSKTDYLAIPYQFIAFLVGFIDGDGYFPIIRSTKGYISIK